MSHRMRRCSPVVKGHDRTKPDISGHSADKRIWGATMHSQRKGLNLNCVVEGTSQAVGVISLKADWSRGLLLSSTPTIREVRSEDSRTVPADQAEVTKVKLSFDFALTGGLWSAKIQVCRACRN